MNLLYLLIICGLCALVAWRFSKDTAQGLALLVGLLVFLPHRIRLDFPGALPALTVHRALLLTVFFVWLGKGRERRRAPAPVLSRFLWWVVGISLIALPFSTAKGASFKQVLAFILENVFFYFVVSRAVRTSADVRRVLLGAMCGLALVAVNSFFERYADRNLVDFLPVLASQAERDRRSYGDTESTYPHRILFGYAMAMGAVLVVGFPWRQVSADRWVARVLPVVLLSACYFSRSRGPWLAAFLGSCLLFLMGSTIIRRRVVVLACLAGGLLLARPGVLDTITNLGKATFQSDTTKAKSYDYRWKLWGVAIKEIRKSPLRLAFGYGEGTTDFMDLSEHFGYQEGGNTIVTGFTSWDNQYASDLIELGLVGAGLNYALYLLLIRLAYQAICRSRGADRALAVGLCASGFIYLFAMSNVAMFSPQLTFLFWTVAALTAVMRRLPAEPKEGATQCRPSSVTDAVSATPLPA